MARRKQGQSWACFALPVYIKLSLPCSSAMWKRKFFLEQRNSERSNSTERVPNNPDDDDFSLHTCPSEMQDVQKARKEKRKFQNIFSRSLFSRWHDWNKKIILELEMYLSSSRQPITKKDAEIVCFLFCLLTHIEMDVGYVYYCGSVSLKWEIKNCQWERERGSEGEFEASGWCNMK